MFLEFAMSRIKFRNGLGKTISWNSGVAQKVSLGPEAFLHNLCIFFPYLVMDVCSLQLCIQAEENANSVCEPTSPPTP